MDLSTPFSYVPYIGDSNIINVIDNTTGLPHKFLMSLDAAGKPYFIPKNAKGDEGNALNGAGSVASYTSKKPTGRAGTMITYLDLISEGVNTNSELLDLLLLVRIPAGLAGLLGPEYTLSKQPPAESFDYSKWLPRTEAHGCLSFYGGVQSSSSGLSPSTGRFPTLPSLPPFTSGSACPLLYLPPGFEGGINTILNGLQDPDIGIAPFSGFDVTVDDDALYGTLLVAGSFNAGVFGEGTGKITVDFSHSATN